MMFRIPSSLTLIKECLFSCGNSLQISSKRCLSTQTWSYVKPGKVSERLTVPSYIPLPPYALTGEVPDLRFLNPPIRQAEVKNEGQIGLMRRSCRLARFVLDSIEEIIRVGITTDELDKFAHELITDNAAYPSPLNYRGFPKSICTSVNNVACHGIPDDRPLADGDIINVDVTVYLSGFHGDCSKTFLVGNVDEAGKKLVKVAEEAMMAGIEVCKPGEHFYRIGKEVSDYASDHGYTSIGVFAGHGIGTYFHGPPDIFHIYNRNTAKMEPGMTFTVEPILSEGQANVIILNDEWTAITEDGSRTAQFENTILITEEGYEILTKPYPKR
ncbi:unnamed protein product [Bemisia tabaci]|uniref:Methionine aminopeptidase n=1 Tax=Bemisia tabaci TaxID=7038 RepID=A0A9P0AM45_BEMTA|nr:unnamed protein product [Bemisia tabaci]